MGLPAVKFEAQLHLVECWACQMMFGVTSYFESRRREDHQTFYCPAGHGQVWAAETDLEKERRKSQMLADQVRMEREERLKVERKLKRVHNGTCPHCNRSFANLARHMKSKHEKGK